LNHKGSQSTTQSNSKVKSIKNALFKKLQFSIACRYTVTP
jgi:hypothetical protein